MISVDVSVQAITASTLLLLLQTARILLNDFQRGFSIECGQMA